MLQKTQLLPPMRSLLSKPKILEHKELGNIVILPFEEHNLNSASYDVRLGEYYFQEQPFRADKSRIFNPFDPDDIRRLWGEPQRARLAREWIDEHGRLVNIRPDDKIIIIGNGETILGHTEEFIGGKNCVTSEMRARSSVGRIGVTVCKCASWGNLGFCNRWTMEITNHLKDSPMLLLVGMRVAQIAFYQVDPYDQSYAQSGGQFQQTDDEEELRNNWTPLSLLPRFDRNNP